MLFFCFRKLTGFFLDEISAALIPFSAGINRIQESSNHIKEEQVRTWLYGEKERVPLFN
jgi:hypothetical protein